jgi:hypothetical protein
MMMKNFILIFLLSPLTFFGWGKEGHQIVALIAKSKLDEPVKEKVSKYLNGMSFEEAATWMDDIKKDKSQDYMKPWHYVNVEKGGVYKANDTIGDIYKELNLTIEKLKNYHRMSDEEVNKEIKILFHLCGDMVQPLHVGFGIDKGGNDIKVDYKGKQSNLHRVWDSEMIQSESINYDKCMQLLQSYPQKQIQKINSFTIDSWMTESRELLPKAYKFKDGKITEKYISKNAPLVESQLVVGGVRLAHLLNEIFKN